MGMEKDPIEEDSDDSNDQDYVLGNEDNLPSEEEDDGEPEEDFMEDRDNSRSACKRKPNQKNKTNKKTKVTRQAFGATAQEDNMNETKQETTNLSEEDEKKKTDSLWSDFLQDSSSPKQSNNITDLNTSLKNNSKMESQSEAKKKPMVTITEVFQFAGEEVKISKEVPVHSAEAKNAVCIAPQLTNGFVSKAFVCKESNKSLLVNGGISSVLNQIGKKAKIGTLEKSKLDWDRFKSTQGIEEEIQVHNRGRGGFLERQDFLQRADIRQFEIEKQMRKITRSNR